MRAWDYIHAAAWKAYSHLERVPIPQRSYAQPPGPAVPGKQLAAVCAYYNPSGYRARVANYNKFAEYFSQFRRVPLLTVELAMGGRGFDLQPSPWVLQVKSDDVLWQKERLLDIGIRRLLDEGYENIAWVDADVEMADPYWPERTVAVLREFEMCQLFAEAVRRDKNGAPNDVRRGVAHEFHRSRMIRLIGLSCGYGWAARASLLEQMPLYDAAILGGGDAAIWLGAICRPTWEYWRQAIEHIQFYQNMGPRMREHYLDWARRWGSCVQSRVGYVEQTLYTDYHGKLRNRRFGTRYRWIDAFDPARDLRRNADDVWAWNRENNPAITAIEQPVRKYFAIRKEDE